MLINISNCYKDQWWTGNHLICIFSLFETFFCHTVVFLRLGSALYNCNSYFLAWKIFTILNLFSLLNVVLFDLWTKICNISHSFLCLGWHKIMYWIETEFLCAGWKWFSLWPLMDMCLFSKNSEIRVWGSSLSPTVVVYFHFAWIPFYDYITIIYHCTINGYIIPFQF